MHKVKRLWKKGLEDNDTEFMYIAEHDFMDVLNHVKTTNPNWYSNIEMKWHKHFYGDHLCEDMAKEMVCKFKNEDGTTGAHWTMEQTESVNIHKCHKYDWYVALNMVYSDYYNPKFSDEDYVKMAHQYLHDKDGVSDKLVRKYYMVH